MCGKDARSCTDVAHTQNLLQRCSMSTAGLKASPYIEATSLHCAFTAYYRHTDLQEVDPGTSPYKPLSLRVREFDKTPGRFKKKPEPLPPPKPLSITEAKVRSCVALTTIIWQRRSLLPVLHVLHVLPTRHSY